MPTSAIDWQSAAEIAGVALVLFLAIWLWFRHEMGGAEVESLPPRCCLRCGWPHAVRELGTGELCCGGCFEPWNPGHAVHPNALPDDDIDLTVVDAQPTLLPLEDAEHIHCTLCGAPLSSLSKGSCWNCSTPNDRSAA